MRLVPVLFGVAGPLRPVPLGFLCVLGFFCGFRVSRPFVRGISLLLGDWSIYVGRGRLAARFGH